MKKFDKLEDTLKPLKKIMDKTKEKSVPMIASEFLKDSNYYAPMVTGDLKRSGINNSRFNEGIIEWKTPYARRLFYNPQYNFSKDANPNAQGLWAEKAKQENKDKYKDISNDNFEEAKKEVL